MIVRARMYFVVVMMTMMKMMKKMLFLLLHYCMRAYVMINRYTNKKEYKNSNKIISCEIGSYSSLNAKSCSKEHIYIHIVIYMKEEEK